MNRLAIRVWLTVAVVICACLGTAWVRSGYTFEVRPLSRTLESLPIELDGYQGSDTPMENRVKEILNADSFVNRIYRRPDGAIITLHASAWVRPDAISSVALHNPQLCYSMAGWKILQEKNYQITTKDGSVPLGTLLVERGGERQVVAYWYQIGRSTFNTIEECRQIHRELWGKPVWPATIKVLLQSPAQTIDDALPLIKSFASNLFELTNDL